MKACVIQPRYSFDPSDLDRCYLELVSLLDQCTDEMDLIVLPEYSDALADAAGKAGFYSAVEKYAEPLLLRACETARRCHALGAKKVQLFKPYFNQESIDKAHASGIRCNVFYADDPDEARRYFEMGIDTVLTNDYLTIANEHKKLYEKRNKE